MAYEVKQLPTLTATTSAANAATVAIGALDDAESITIYLISTRNAGSSSNGLSIQVSQFDPSLASSASVTGITVSTAFHTLSSTIFSSAIVTSSGGAFTLSPVSFKGLRLAGLTSATNGENIAFISKQVLI
jgi:methenyltetrahydromethanopterin cyclohydrolase